MLNKFLYVLTRDLGIFSLPGLRRFRNLVYQSHLDTIDINVDKGARIQPLHRRGASTFQIGRELHVGAHCIIDLSGSIKIGDRVTLSDGAKVFTHSHPIDGGPRNWRRNPVKFSQLQIGDDVWIGANAIILGSVTRIGEGAVVAAGAIVGRDVDSNTVVGGIPAKYLRHRQLNE